MAMTGFYYTFKRPRTAPMMGMMKYDPIGATNPAPLLPESIDPPLANCRLCRSPRQSPLSRDEKENQGMMVDDRDLSQWTPLEPSI